MSVMCRGLPTALLLVSATQAQPPGDIELAFARLYNFDFPGAHAHLDRHVAAYPRDPRGPAMHASAWLFFELDRLGILESEFLADDRRIIDKRKLRPDPGVRTKLFAAIDRAQALAMAALAANPNDSNALFAMCIATGVVVDYTALIEKRQWSSLGQVKRSAGYAQRLLKIDPSFTDAYLSTGLTEYLICSLPFFLRWFVRIDDIKGSKDVAVRNLDRVARDGRYLRAFAKILLAVLYLREKQPSRTETLLAELARDYPENPLFRKELAKLSAKLRNGELRDAGAR